MLISSSPLNCFKTQNPLDREGESTCPLMKHAHTSEMTSPLPNPPSGPVGMRGRKDGQRKRAGEEGWITFYL